MLDHPAFPTPSKVLDNAGSSIIQHLPKKHFCQSQTSSEMLDPTLLEQMLDFFQSQTSSSTIQHYPTLFNNIQHFDQSQTLHHPALSTEMLDVVEQSWIIRDGARGSLTLTEMLDVFGRCWIMLDGARGSLTLTEMLDVVGQC